MTYAEYCQSVKSMNREHRLRTWGQVPLKGHHIVPVHAGGDGDNDDWTHPNIVPFTPSENYVAHKKYIEENPDDEKAKKEFSPISSKFPDPASFEKYVIWMYDYNSVDHV